MSEREEVFNEFYDDDLEHMTGLMTDEIVRLRRALAACERDSERLNWLGKQIDGVHVEAGLAGGEYQMRRFATVFTFTSEFRAETVRDAIDKAMNRAAVVTAQGE
jgi:hypothetical protein